MKTSSLSVNFFIGSGGVGKSTLSTLYAVDKCLKGHKVLIATFDPSKRLKDILKSKNEFSSDLLKNNLEIKFLDSKEIFQDLLKNIDPKIAESIQKNKLFKNLIERVQGIQEFSSLYFLDQNISLAKYDFIIIDTPPLQNSMDFFTSPEKLKNLFESMIVKLFIGEFNKNWIEKIFRKTRDIAFATLKKLTGLDFFEQLVALMKALEKLQPVILNTLQKSSEVFHSKETHFYIVTTNELSALQRVSNTLQSLKKVNIHSKNLIINKAEQHADFEYDSTLDMLKSNHKNELCSYFEEAYKAGQDRKSVVDHMTSAYQLEVLFYPKIEFNLSQESELIKLSGKFYGTDKKI